jgi:acetyl esterase/lipase
VAATEPHGLDDAGGTGPDVVHHRTRSVRSRILTAAAQRAAKPYLNRLVRAPHLQTQSLQSLARLDALAAWVPAPRGTFAEPTTVRAHDGSSLAAEWVHGPGVPPLRTRIVLYLHGGGWLFGGLNSHRALISRISAACGIPALLLDYRMVPQVSFDLEVEDCIAGYRWLLSLGVQPGNVVIMGDSAGGHLALATALRTRGQRLPMPGALVGLSGIYDMSTAGKSAHINAHRDPSGTMAALEWMMQVALGDSDPACPELSPVHADLRGLPPTLLMVSSSEVTYCDSELLAKLLAAAGVPCTLHVWHDQLHVFQALGRLVPEALRAITQIGEFVRSVHAGHAPPRRLAAGQGSPTAAELPEKPLLSRRITRNALSTRPPPRASCRLNQRVVCGVGSDAERRLERFSTRPR